jgi:alanyl-tRNA synthetase
VTERLYYHDSYLRSFETKVVERTEDGAVVFLAETAFYPSSGGQPNDTGRIGDSIVTDVFEHGGRVAHRVGSPVDSDSVFCSIDWDRRFDHMQQHTGQHLLSAVLQEMAGIPTVSFHLGSEVSTIDVAVASLAHPQIEEIELEANRRIAANLPVSVTFELASEAAELRKASTREGSLRIVAIQGLDRSACGGTHVRSTAEIGPLQIRRLDKIRGNTRIEFVCGLRAVRRARADCNAHSQIGRILSAPLDETPVLVGQQVERLNESAKSLRRIGMELATLRGRHLYEETPQSEDGIRRALHRLDGGAIDDEARAFAQGFVSGGRCVIAIVAERSRSVLLAASADSGVHAAERLKGLLESFGGRGGGNAALAQGSLSSAQALEELIPRLL